MSRLIRSLIFLGLAAVSLEASSVIFGDYSIAPVTRSSSLEKELSQGVGIILKGSIIDGFLELTPRSVGGSICEEVPFWGATRIGVATTFLIAENIAVTSGHSISSAEDCQNSHVDFDYRENISQERLFLARRDLASCEEILAHDTWVAETGETVGYTIYRISASEKKRSRLTLSAESPQLFSPIFSIGHPLGMPLRVSSDAEFGRLGEDTAQANLDAFQGMSGAPVFNGQGHVEGFILSGPDSFHPDHVESQRQQMGCFGPMEYSSETYLISVLTAERWRQAVREVLKDSPSSRVHRPASWETFDRGD